MSEKRGHWYLLTGLIFGLLLGILHSLVIAPAEFIDVSPAMLNDELKDEYRGVVALAYQSNQDLGRAWVRLNLLEDEDNVTALLEQSQRIMKAGGSRMTSQALLKLADDLKKNPMQLTTPLASPQPDETQLPGITGTPTGTGVSVETHLDETVSLTVSATATIEEAKNPVNENMTLPTLTKAQDDGASVEQPSSYTATPTVAQSPAFILQDRSVVCEADVQPGLLQIEVKDAAGEPLPGVQINITWDGGEEVFFTGLYPQIDPGYADFEMETGQQYRLKVGSGGELVDDIVIPDCKEGQNTFGGGVSLTFGL